MSDEHFTVDGTLIEAWASQKSFQRKHGGNDEGDRRDFRGQTRKNDTHASKTDPDARLYRKSAGTESRLAYLGHLLIVNRHGLIADAMATVADGLAEREAATLMVANQVTPPTAACPPRFTGAHKRPQTLVVTLKGWGIFDDHTWGNLDHP